MHAVVARPEVLKTDGPGPFFEVRMWFGVAGARDSAPCQKLQISKHVGRRGTFEENPQRCISRGRHGTRDMVIRDVRRSGR